MGKQGITGKVTQKNGNFMPGFLRLKSNRYAPSQARPAIDPGVTPNEFPIRAGLGNELALAG
jgi:hypothetical protein